MQVEQTTTAIARELASLWQLHQTSAFERYVIEAYGEAVKLRPHFRCLYIGETEEGDLQTGPKPGLIRSWWQVDDRGLRPVKRPNFDWDTDDTFYATPEILFCVVGDEVVLVETLGRRLRRWLRGKLNLSDAGVRLTNLQVL
jgi:hypothetical protein